jgi:hypothetical protein
MDRKSTIYSATIVLCLREGGRHGDLYRFGHLPLVQEIDSLTCMVEGYQRQRSEKCYVLIFN